MTSPTEPASPSATRSYLRDQLGLQSPTRLRWAAAVTVLAAGVGFGTAHQYLATLPADYGDNGWSTGGLVVSVVLATLAAALAPVWLAWVPALAVWVPQYWLAVHRTADPGFVAMGQITLGPLVDSCLVMLLAVPPIVAAAVAADVLRSVRRRAEARD